MLLHFILFLALAQYSLARHAGHHASVGERCFLGGFAPTLCQNGLTCVLSSFGDPKVDRPRAGVCQKLIEKTSPCSVAICSATGAETLCRAPRSEGEPASLVATCRAWATRTDGGPGPVCPEICTAEFDPVYANDGSKHGNKCQLQAASCASNFEIYGPVPPPDACKPPISIFDAADCCIERDIGCLDEGSVCSSIASFVRPVPCKPGLTCVITDFGFPAADVPNSGTCRRTRGKIPGCTVPYCAWKGANAVCEVLEPRNSGIVSTCKAWARRSDGNPKPNCNLVCPENCLSPELQPMATDGTKYCNLCFLTRASCQSDFMIYFQCPLQFPTCRPSFGPYGSVRE